MNANRVSDGVNMVAIGCILLANTIGGLPWAVWISIFSLWPIALIAIGVDLIGKSTGRVWVRVLASLITLSALLYGAFVMQPGTWGLPAMAFRSGGGGLVDFSQTEPRVPGIVEGNASIDLGGTRAVLSGGADLATLNGRAVAGQAPSLAAGSRDGVADVSVSSPKNGTFVIGMTGGGSRTNVSLDREVRWKTLALNAGATDLNADLSGMRLDLLTANVGASSVKIKFPAGETCRAQVNGGAASVVFEVPRDSGVSLTVQGFPVATDVPAGFAKRDGAFGNGTWTRTGTAGNVSISVSAGAASVEIIDY